MYKQSKIYQLKNAFHEESKANTFGAWKVELIAQRWGKHKIVDVTEAKIVGIDDQ